jgi:hypothetical protein
VKDSIFPSIRQAFSHVPENDPRAKIGPRIFIIALITSMAADGKKRSIASLRRNFASSTGSFLARSTFWQRLSSDRLTNLLVKTIRELVLSLAAELNTRIGLLAKLGVRAVYLLDSSSVTLPKGARKDLPAPRSNVIKASAKWHLCWNLLSGVSEWFCISDGKVHDRNGFPPLEMLKGALIIFDLGYWDYQLISDLMTQGCFFLSRVKSNALIEITGIPSNQQWQHPIGKNLFSLNWAKYRGDVFEMLGSVSFGDGDCTELRVIGFWNQATKTYHWYITNLPIKGEIIYPLYRIRWQIELVFKAGKSSLHFADLTSSNFNIIINIMLASIITNLIAQPLSRSTLDRATEEVQRSISVQRAGFVFAHVAPEMMHYLISGRKKDANILWAKLLLYIEEFIDPNYKNRPTSLQMLGLLL